MIDNLLGVGNHSVLSSGPLRPIHIMEIRINVLSPLADNKGRNDVKSKEAFACDGTSQVNSCCGISSFYVWV